MPRTVHFWSVEFEEDSRRRRLTCARSTTWLHVVFPDVNAITGGILFARLHGPTEGNRTLRALQEVGSFDDYGKKKNKHE